MNDKQLFKSFLILCQSNNVAVWADPKLERDGRGTGFWHGPPVNGHSSISVLRLNAIQVTSIQPTSSDAKIAEFIDGSQDIQVELATLLHEYGHWFFQHPTVVDNKLKYQQEVEAWEKGEEIARKLGMQDFSIFNADKERSLAGYREGLGIK